MGMFDTVTINCPRCGSVIEEQSKSGPCRGEYYSLWDIPLAIIADLHTKSKNEELSCNGCGTIFVLKVRAQVALRVLDEGTRASTWREF